jgi:NAD+ diphosphatase
VKFKYCPNCGKESLTEDKEKFVCGECGHEVYKNAAACASTLPVKEGKVLVAVRKHDPYKGTYDVIGGFVSGDESAEEAAIRETKEETGLDVKIIKLIGTYPDKYGEDGTYVLCIQFLVEITGGEMKATDDVEKLEWVAIKDIPSLKNIGFKSAEKTLLDLYRDFSEK